VLFSGGTGCEIVGEPYNECLYSLTFRTIVLWGFINSVGYSRALSFLLRAAMANPNAISFANATAVKVVNSHTYEVNLEDDWCIGTGTFNVTFDSS
jgi:hypothetical protein